MKATLVTLLSLGAAILICGSVRLSAGDASKDDAANVIRLVSAIEGNDYSSFIANGEPQFMGFPKERFVAVATQLGPILKKDHLITYLGELNQKGYHVTLWKISFKDGSDDALATLSVKDGKVGGFWIR